MAINNSIEYGVDYEEIFQGYLKRYPKQGGLQGDLNKDIEEFTFVPSGKIDEIIESEPRAIYLPLPSHGLTEEQIGLPLNWERPLVDINDIVNSLEIVDKSKIESDKKADLVGFLLDEGLDTLSRNQRLLKLVDRVKNNEKIELYRAAEKDAPHRFGAYTLGKQEVPILKEYQGYPVSWWLVKESGSKTSENTFLDTKKGRETIKESLAELLKNGFVLPDENSDGIVYIDLKDTSIDPVIV